MRDFYKKDNKHFTTEKTTLPLLLHLGSLLQTLEKLDLFEKQFVSIFCNMNKTKCFLSSCSQNPLNCFDKKFSKNSALGIHLEYKISAQMVKVSQSLKMWFYNRKYWANFILSIISPAY